MGHVELKIHICIHTWITKITQSSKAHFICVNLNIKMYVDLKLFSLPSIVIVNVLVLVRSQPSKFGRF